MGVLSPLLLVSSPEDPRSTQESLKYKLTEDLERSLAPEGLSSQTDSSYETNGSMPYENLKN